MDFHERIQPVEPGNRWIRVREDRRGGHGGGAFHRDQPEDEPEPEEPTDAVEFSDLDAPPGCDLGLLLAAYSLQQALASLGNHWLGFVLPDWSDRGTPVDS